jgi:hydrogenase maturation protease
MAGAVVIGVGNRWRGDDGVGPAVLDALRDQVAPGVELIESDGEPTRLLDAFAGRSPVVMIDAVKTGAPPGTVHRFPADELPAGIGIGQSSHLVALVDTIAMGKLLGRLPQGLVVIGIEATDFDHGRDMTPPVAAAVETAVRAVLEELGG